MESCVCKCEYVLVRREGKAREVWLPAAMVKCVGRMGRSEGDKWRAVSVSVNMC